jgi:glutamate 5-kinase
LKGSARNFKRIVVKIGSSLFYSAANNLDLGLFNSVAKQVADLAKAGKEMVVVSSGAVALGMRALGLKERPKDLSLLQAAAAIGQNEVIWNYRSFFRSKDYHSAQVLLTYEDFKDSKRRLNAKNTLLTLLKYGTIPIVNENDTVATDEIKFGDNDRLSALVASLINADLLIILSDVDGLLDKDKKVIRVVVEITPGIKALATSTNRVTSVGGMVTKIEAAKIAVLADVPCVIANGRTKDIILSVIEEPERTGTLFLAKKNITTRKHRIAFFAKPKGIIIVDDGARCALFNKKSLLSVGIVGLSGSFEAGDIVSITDKKHCEFARGKANIGCKQLEKIKGCRFDKEAIHCDNIVIL